MGCQDCTIHPVKRFDSPSEELELEARLRDHDSLQPASEPQGWRTFGVDENFYRCRNCGQVWVHAESDAPFRGSWQQVSS